MCKSVKIHPVYKLSGIQKYQSHTYEMYEIQYDEFTICIDKKVGDNMVTILPSSKNPHKTPYKCPMNSRLVLTHSTKCYKNINVNDPQERV